MSDFIMLRAMAIFHRINKMQGWKTRDGLFFVTVLGQDFGVMEFADFYFKRKGIKGGT